MSKEARPLVERISISQFRHRISGAVVADPVVKLDDETMRVRIGHLPGNLARLVPNRWGNAPSSAWVPFVMLAAAMGHFGRSRM